MKKKILLGFIVFLVIATLFFPSCSPKIKYNLAIPVDKTFHKVAEKSRYEKAAAYSQKHNGFAIVVLEGNDIVFEQYQNGSSATTPHHIFSGTKSFSAAMIMAAVQDGILSLDERVADTISEWKTHPKKSQITVRHLLNFTSGVQQKFWRLSYDSFTEKRSVANKYDYALALSCNHNPGSKFEYGSSHQMILGELMRRKTHRSALAYLNYRIFFPINFRYSGWLHDNYGNPMLPYGCWTTAREWCKFGVLVRDDGEYLGRRILAPGFFRICAKGSAAMPAYGLNFWLNAEVSENQRQDLIPQLRDNPPGRILCAQAPEDLIVAAGHNGNRLYIVPSKNLVIARLGNSEKDFHDEDFLACIFSKGEFK